MADTRPIQRPRLIDWSHLEQSPPPKGPELKLHPLIKTAVRVSLPKVGQSQ